MGDRRVWGGLAIVAAVAIGTGAGVGCGDDGGRPAAASHPRDDQIRSTIDGVWSAIGLERERVTVAEYAYTFAPDNDACADLSRDDRWFGERGSSGTVTGSAPAEVERALLDHLDGAGFTVTRYRSTHPESALRRAIARKGDVVVDSTLDGTGYATVDVRSGPCAPGFARVDPKLFEPVR
jgi:hypothetical protein